MPRAKPFLPRVAELGCRQGGAKGGQLDAGCAVGGQCGWNRGSGVWDEGSGPPVPQENRRMKDPLESGSPWPPLRGGPLGRLHSPCLGLNT